MTDAQQDDSSAENEYRASENRPGADSRAITPTRNGYASIAAYTANAAETEEGTGLNLREYWRILNKRKWLIAGIAAASLLIGLLWTLLQTPLYTSTVRIQVDPHTVKVVEGGNVAPTESDPEFMKTQYELLQSRNMAERVTSMLQLQNAELGALLTRVRVRPVVGSRLFDISYSDPDPEKAQRIAAGYGEAFIAFNVDKRFQANAYAKTFLEDQIKQLKLRLEEAERATLDFAQKEQIVATTDKTSIAETNLAAANAALGAIIADRIKNEQLWKQVASATAIDMPQLLTNRAIEELRSRRNLLVTEYQEKSDTFQPSYPAMVQIANKIKEVDRQLATEVKTIRSSLKAAYESSLSQEGAMKQRIETLRAEVLDLQKRSIQFNLLKREADSTRTLYEGLMQRYKEVDVAGGVGSTNIFVVDRAELPSSPSSPVMSRALSFALAIGLALGLAATYALEYFDDVIYSPDDAERFGLAALGVIPKVKPPGAIEAEIADPRSAPAEAYRSLATALQFSTETGLPKTLLVTSASPSEGKSITSLAVARHFAKMGLKVLVVDADLRNPSLHDKMSLDNRIGLSNYLTGSCLPPEAMQPTNVANLFFMASGPLPPNAADLLGSSRVHSLLSIGLEVFDFIVVDGPPVLGMADAILLSNATAATVFVIGAGVARVGAVRNALKRLQLTHTPIIGTTITRFDAKAAGYGYGHQYGYGYGYGYGAKDDAEAKLEHSGQRQLNNADDGDK